MFPKPRSSRLGVAFIGAVAALAFTSSPASASYCPAGTDYVIDYCVNSASLFATIIGDDFPEAWYRLDDGDGAQTMTDNSGNGHHGEYKNEQDSGPIGISAGDNNRARDFWGRNGYGFVNGIPAPGPDNGYTSYTMEAWFYQRDTDTFPLVHDDAMIMQLGGGGALYVKDGMVRFRNGPNDEIAFAPAGFSDNTWYYVVGRKTGITMELWVRESPSTPIFFNQTPNAFGTSHYRPGGTPTFYIGYGEYAPWFNGPIDEASYYKHAVPSHRIAYHFYADPAPPEGLARGGAVNAKPGAPKNSVNPAKLKAAQTKQAKLRRARADVKRLYNVIAKAQRQVRALTRHHAKAKTIRKAKATLKSARRQLIAAKAKVKRLS